MTDRESWRRDVPVDPTGIDKPHDILAADEFGIGTRDERLPPDPNRFDPPHDILAAEEFAMPAGGERQDAEGAGGPDPRTLVPLLVIAAILAFVLVRRRN
ncbi:MAG: hypothetical protein H0T69_10230 [Thermoleophilaceae bacterium]|nr:hypothetical protein [Thermoleophilaceae bacterium]